jgi:ATP-dependent helicase HepA
LDDGGTEFRWTNGSLNISSNRLKIGVGADGESRLVSGTFARPTALAREDLQFFAPGHDLIDTMIFEAEHGTHSRVSAYTLEGFPKNRGTILLQVLGRSVLDERLWRGQDIGPGLAVRARSLLWPEIMAEIMLLWDKSGAHQDIVTHGGLRSLLDHPQIDRALQPIEPKMISGLSYLPQLWTAIDKATPAALSSIMARRADTASERAEMLEASLRPEVGFLRWQAETAATDEGAAEHRAAIAARDALVQSLRGPRVDLLGLALVVLV